MQFVLCNLVCTVQSLLIPHLGLHCVPQFSLHFALSMTLSSAALYRSAQGSAPLTLSNHSVTESGALGGISGLLLTHTSLPVSKADLAN